MTTASRPYNSPLREAQASATRDLILDATHELLQTTRPVDLSFKDVATSAGVSVRTVYRHYPSHDALFMALAKKVLVEHLGTHGTLSTDLDAAMAQLKGWYEALDGDRSLFRLLCTVPIRTAAQGEQATYTITRQLLPGASEDLIRKAAATADLLTSPYAWDVFTSSYGMDATEAHRVTSVDITALVEFLRREPGALDPDAPLPHLRFRQNSDATDRD